MLMLHIIIGLSTIISALGSLMLLNRHLTKATPYLLGATATSGIGLLLVDPTVSIVHLCASGLALSVVSILLHKAATRRLATAS